MNIDTKALIKNTREWENCERFEGNIAIANRLKTIADKLERLTTYPAFYEFREEEVAVSKSTNLTGRVKDRVLRLSGGTPVDLRSTRPLRLSEMPKAVEGLRKAAVFCSQDWGDAHKLIQLREALAAFDEVIHE